MEMDLPLDFTFAAVLGASLGLLLVAHLLLPPIYVAALLVAAFRSSRTLPAGFRTFLRAGCYLHCLVLLLSVPYLVAMVFVPSLDPHGSDWTLVIALLVAPALVGLGLSYVLFRMSEPDTPLSLSLTEAIDRGNGSSARA